MCKWLCLAGLCALVRTAAAQPAESVLENGTLRIVIRGALVTSLYDKQRGREYITPEPDASVGLLRVLLVKDDKPVGEVDAVQLRVGPVQRRNDAVTIAFEGARVRAEVRVEFSGAPGEARWAISVQPKEADVAVGRVDFPVLQMRRPLDGAGDQFLVPVAEGRLFTPSRASLWRTYPTDMAAQMVAYYGPGGGCLLWADDTEGSVKSFGFQAHGRPRMAVQVRHRMPYVPAKRWEPAYHVRTTFCDGAWQAAADIYRAWQSGQFWCKTKLRDRTDIPPLLHHPPLCISSQLTRETLDDLPARLASYRKRFGVPLIYRPLGWEKHDNWVGIDYFPPSVGAGQFRRLAERLLRDEMYLCGFISGYHWTYASETATAEVNRRLAQYFEQHRGPQVCERGPDGELAERVAEVRHLRNVCRGTDFGRQFLQETSRRLLDLGVTSIHDDQDPGPRPDGIVSCFDRSHGHPVPCGPWSTRVMVEAFSEIRAEASRRGAKHFLLTKEYDAELFNMILHGYQNRNFHDSVIPQLVPLVQYLNHEYIPVIFGWVTATDKSIRSLAAMCVYGQVPCLAFWGAPAEPVDALPEDAAAFLDDYFAAMAGHAKRYLLYGKMLRPMVSDVPEVTKEQRRWKRQVFDPPRLLRLPLVIQSAWEDEEGDVGVFAVNLSAEELEVACQAPADGAWRATYYVGGTKAAAHDVEPGVAAGWTLAPGRLHSLVFSRRRPE